MKRKKLKKALCLAAAPVFCLSLFSCSDKREGNTSVQSQKEQSVQTNENGELIFVGNPTYDGKGGGFLYDSAFGIMETSDCKEGAWLLIEEFLGDKHFESLPVGFSPLEKNLNIEDEYLDTYMRSLTDNTFYDYDVMDIIEEEAEYYYSGERTTQECTEIINNRISIKIAEQTWQT